MKEVIIIEGIRYVLKHITLYCPIISETKKDRKYGLSLVVMGLDGQKVQILFDDKFERDAVLRDLDLYFGVEDKEPVTVQQNTNDFLQLEAKKSGYIVDSIT
jgi:hypothetical protein